MTSDPPKLADGTGATRYAPRPGDIVSVSASALPPELGLFGYRVGYVERCVDTAVVVAAWVRLPGYERPFAVSLSHVELLWRAPIEGP